MNIDNNNLSVFALGAIDIEDPDVVGKSFPGFWEEFGKTGVRV